MRLVLISFVVGSITCQYHNGAKYSGDPKTAAILQEARYLSVNGAFGAAYQQEDGIDFKEETDPDGSRRGSYSYIDPSGERKTVNYVAGKNGFQATGDHIPTAPLPVAPTPGYKPDPRYNSPDYQTQQYNAPAPVRSPGVKPDENDGQYYPELYERENYVEPQQARQQYTPQQYTAQQYQPAQQYTPQQHQPAQQYQAIPQQYKAQPQHYQSIYPGVQQAQYSGVYNQLPQQQSNPQYYEPTTQSPARIFPPGKFSLNRAPDGYTYSFQKV